MAYVEKTTSPEETILETKVEPEPVFIDEVLHFLRAQTFTNPNDLSIQTTNPKLLLLLLFLQGKMDRTLALLQNADPADPAPDSQELIQLEGINLNAGVNLVSPPLLFSNSVSVPLPNRSL